MTVSLNKVKINSLLKDQFNHKAPTRTPNNFSTLNRSRLNSNRLATDLKDKFQIKIKTRDNNKFNKILTLKHRTTLSIKIKGHQLVSHSRDKTKTNNKDRIRINSNFKLKINNRKIFKCFPTMSY